MKTFEITEIEIIPVRPQQGVVAFASCSINECFHVGNIAIHTSPRHPLGFRTVFPTIKLHSGKQVACFYPYTKEAEEIVTSAIVRKYLELMNNFQN